MEGTERVVKIFRSVVDSLCFNQFDPVEGTERYIVYPIALLRQHCFNQFDPVEGTERPRYSDLRPRPPGFNQFDPVEGTERSIPGGGIGRLVEFQPVRPGGGY